MDLVDGDALALVREAAFWARRVQPFMSRPGTQDLMSLAVRLVSEVADSHDLQDEYDWTDKETTRRFILKRVIKDCHKVIRAIANDIDAARLGGRVKMVIKGCHKVIRAISDEIDAVAREGKVTREQQIDINAAFVITFAAWAAWDALGPKGPKDAAVDRDVRRLLKRSCKRVLDYAMEQLRDGDFEITVLSDQALWLRVSEVARAIGPPKKYSTISRDVSAAAKEAHKASVADEAEDNAEKARIRREASNPDEASTPAKATGPKKARLITNGKKELHRRIYLPSLPQWAREYNQE